jgi:hypothetical protein
MSHSFPANEKRCRTCDCIMQSDERECHDCGQVDDDMPPQNSPFAGLTISDTPHQRMHVGKKSARRRDPHAVLSA